MFLSFARIEAALNKHLENSKEIVERKFLPEVVPEELPEVLPSTSYAKHYLRYGLTFSHSHLAFPQKSPLFLRDRLVNMKEKFMRHN